MGLGRFELPTSPLSGVRSSQLSYRPGIAGARGPIGSLARAAGILRPDSAKLSRRVSRTRLNVRTGYADPDHRLIESEKEKVEFRLFRSALTGQDRIE